MRVHGHVIQQSDDIVVMKKPFDRSRLVESLGRAALRASIPWGDDEDDFKPFGLWYGKGSSWWDWCRDSDFGDVERCYVYRVEIVKDDMLHVQTKDDVLGLIRRFRKKEEGDSLRRLSSLNVGIDWKALTYDYDGVEFSPYLYEERFNLPSWYIALDVPSGCVWRTRAIGDAVLIRQPGESLAVAEVEEA